MAAFQNGLCHVKVRKDQLNFCEVLAIVRDALLPVEGTREFRDTSLGRILRIYKVIIVCIPGTIVSNLWPKFIFITKLINVLISKTI